jgi:hypothetical protein
VTDEAKACGACGACGATSSPQWWQAEPRLCGHETLCHACHVKIKDGLVALVAAARRLPVAVMLSIAETTSNAADRYEARKQATAAGDGRTCTCVGVCKGRAGLAPGWRCALDDKVIA